ncbi:hypothetical protein E5Q_04367 [Mixia osmundae IAM 14324]|uniref:Acyl-CoA dehydrogenase n=1 Tax=Mixia osmundae (strain CBS 9802 / IAM 14324 / JCM 22182 / KY 12970) TaxID=764103 RepID=G7E4C9_MIXOS|nr:hypothetical protein E5Q_04367 [Mixia osmundae IAM 14324]
MAAHPVTRMISPSTWAMIEDKFSDFGKETLAKVVDFVEYEVTPAEGIYHAQISKDPSQRWKSIPPILADLQSKAKSLGLWNLFLSKAHYPDHGVPLTNLEYAVMAEILGRTGHLGPQATNTSAPDTGNMEVFARYGTDEQKKQWLEPLLRGEIRSAFAMTEKGVASSDATNIQTSLRKDGNEIVISGRKWWISGAGDPRCKVHLVMGKSDPDNSNKHRQQSIVWIPADAPGVTIVRPMQVFGYDDAPEGHMEVLYDNVRVPESNLIAGWGRGFEVIQGRLGPGRIHHCMRAIGIGQRALDLMITRVTDLERKTFGKHLYEHGTIVSGIAKSRMQIDQGRLLVLTAAHQIDKVRAKGAMKDIGMAKVVVPAMVGEVLDRTMQAYGAEGICQDTYLAQAWAGVRTLRYADGPDEVHTLQIGIMELKRAKDLHERLAKVIEAEESLAKKHGIKHHL